MQVQVSMAQSNDFYNIEVDSINGEQLVQKDQIMNVNVPAGEAKSVYLPIVASTLGNIELSVSAQSSQAADGLRRHLLVEVSVQRQGQILSLRRIEMKNRGENDLLWN